MTEDVYKSQSLPLSLENCCILHLHQAWLRTRLTYISIVLKDIKRKKKKCNNNTVFRLCCRGGESSLVALYCSLGIKSGSGAYSGEEKRKSEIKHAALNKECILLHLQNNSRILISLDFCC